MLHPPAQTGNHRQNKQSSSMVSYFLSDGLYLKHSAQEANRSSDGFIPSSSISIGHPTRLPFDLMTICEFPMPQETPLDGMLKCSSFISKGQQRFASIEGSSNSRNVLSKVSIIFLFRILYSKSYTPLLLIWPQLNSLTMPNLIWSLLSLVHFTN